MPTAVAIVTTVVYTVRLGAQTRQTYVAACFFSDNFDFCQAVAIGIRVRVLCEVPVRIGFEGSVPARSFSETRVTSVGPLCSYTGYQVVCNVGIGAGMYIALPGVV